MNLAVGVSPLAQGSLHDLTEKTRHLRDGYSAGELLHIANATFGVALSLLIHWLDTQRYQGLMALPTVAAKKRHTVIDATLN